MKPISTLMSPLPTVDLTSGEPANAQSERSDVTAVPAMGVIAEAMVALVLADAMLEKFGGDSLGEMRRNYQAYVAALGSRWSVGRARGRGRLMPRHLVLVGLPGSRQEHRRPRSWPRRSARRLFDIDQLLVREMGMPVAQIFGMVGEARFREMEHEAVQAAAGAEEPAVIVPGGGWAAQPGHMHWRRAESLCVRSISDASPRQPPSGRSRGRTRRFSWAPTRWSGCGSCSRTGNRFTSSLILRWRRSRSRTGGGGGIGRGPQARRMVARPCHPERSEGPAAPARSTLRSG